MQNSFIIFQKLLVLFGFMLIGYLSYKKKWVSDDTSSQISGLIVNIFNPALIISGVIGSVGNGNWNLVIMDLILAVILFVVLILISLIIYCFRFISVIQDKMSGKGKAVEAAPAEVAAEAVETAPLTDDLELVAVISAAIAASEGTSADSFVVRSIHRR